ncbi:MAG: DUF502 domain-containing protein [Pirellulales bacterium]
MRSFFDWTINRLLRYFVAGVFALLPVVVTVAVVIWVARFLQQFVGPDAPLGRVLGAVGFNFSSDTTMAYVIGWLLVLAVTLIVGVFVEAGARGVVQRAFDALLSRVPLVGGIYGTSKQLVGMLDRTGDAQLSGMRPVFCYFGQEHGCGVLALLVSPKVFTMNGRDYQLVIVPSVPIPMSGGLLFVPSDAVRPADISVESLMSIYVSMGVHAPQFLPSVSPPAQPLSQSGVAP